MSNAQDSSTKHSRDDRQDRCFDVLGQAGPPRNHLLQVWPTAEQGLYVFPYARCLPCPIALAGLPIRNWRRRESNPRPATFRAKFLRA